MGNCQKKSKLQKINDWCDDIGISHNLKESNFNLDHIASINYAEMKNMSIDELDETLMNLDSFALYITGVKSNIKSKLTIINSKLNFLMGVDTEKLAHQKKHKYRTKDEKRSLAIRMNGDLRKLHDKSIELQAKMDRIEDIPRIVRDKINIMREIRRRMYIEQQNERN